MNITQEQNTQPEKSVLELTMENIDDIIAIYGKYKIIPDRYQEAVINAARQYVVNKEMKP